MKKHYLLFGLMAFLLLGLLSDQVFGRQSGLRAVMLAEGRQAKFDQTLFESLQVASAHGLTSCLCVPSKRS